MRLYKYLHPDRVDVLRNGTIRFSSPKVLNDPFELKPYLSGVAPEGEICSDFEQKLPNIIAEEYAKLPPDFRSKCSIQKFQELANSQLPQLKIQFQDFAIMARPRIQKIISEGFEEIAGILCLSESPTNLLMWSHYADSHQGFVIEFDSTSVFFNQKKSHQDEFRHLRKVIYCEQRLSYTLLDINNFSPFLTKSIDWSYEAEWRMLLPLSSAAMTVGNGATTVHLFEYPRSAIKSIILGCRMNESKEKEIRQIITNADIFKNVACLKAEVDEVHYRLHIM